MLLSKHLFSLKNAFANIPGWRTKRKIVVFESDDWGSIRMPSRGVYNKLLKEGIRVDNLPYNRYDSLASEKDLSALYDVLHSVKDKNGRPAIFTANTIVANPDFIKIKESGFREYHYEPFTRTLDRYPEHKKSLNIWKEGISDGIFKPQFHGREHMNVNRWLKALQGKNENVRLAFDLGMFDLSTGQKMTDNSFMDALNFESKSELEELKKSISEGLNIFRSTFKYESLSFIASSYIWHRNLEKTLFENGVRFIQSNYYQLEPSSGYQNNFRKVFHYTGQKSKSGLTFIVRNASFEPSENPNLDWTNVILSRAKTAFFLGKPLVIGTHRLNYIGFVDPTNRDKNLPKLIELLQTLLKKWPDIEFLSSDELGLLMEMKG